MQYSQLERYFVSTEVNIDSDSLRVRTNGYRSQSRPRLNSNFRLGLVLNLNFLGSASGGYRIE